MHELEGQGGGKVPHQGAAFQLDVYAVGDHNTQVVRVVGAQRGGGQVSVAVL